jgi:hypothetical protein
VGDTTSDASDSANGGGNAGNGGNGAGGDGGSSASSADGGSGGSGGNGAEGGSGLVPIGEGEVDPEAPANSGLPPLPRFTSMRAQVVGDSVNLLFDPVLNARDYRVYTLPNPSDVSTSPDGHVYVENAVYRCAGDRQAPLVVGDDTEQIPGGSVKTLVDGQNVGGYTRSLAEATLGYVYPEPGEGRVPVYALGEPSPDSDNLCFSQRWNATRTKQYVTSTSTRDDLLRKGYRDDGIVFYVPSSASSSTRNVLRAVEPTSDDTGARYYFAEGPESAARTGATVAFPILRSETSGALPLMRVFYTNYCGKAHDELVAGKPRFDHVRSQGDHVPLTRLHWSGLTEETLLVVEALDQGCPNQGLLGPKSLPAADEYAAWISPEDAQAAAPHRELFINGQFDGTSPRPIARSFVRVRPTAKPDLDWSYGFSASDDLGTLTKTDLSPMNCGEIYRAKNASADTQFYCPHADRFAQRSLFGEWWVMYTDVAADTNGKYRLTPSTKAEITDDSYLYVTMDVDSFSTLRRYPQIMISDLDAPVQHSLPDGRTLVFQTFADWPNTYELQVCDHRWWDVNNQCPKYDFYQRRDPNDQGKTVAIAPNLEIGEQVGLDYANRWEVYVSSKRAYLFFDGKPHGCADLPSGAGPSGPVTVTFGHVLYHSGVDNLFDFTRRTQQTVSLRKYDNLGFKSGVPAPAWDETRFPCVDHLFDP